MRLFAWSLVGMFCVIQPAEPSTYVAIGGGVKHTAGPALHINVPLHRAIEAHYSYWNDGSHDHALGVGYRLANDGPVSAVLGIAYVSPVTANLLYHADAYLEIRWQFHQRWACQVAHYSSVGDDAGENLLLCGLFIGTPQP